MKKNIFAVILALILLLGLNATAIAKPVVFVSIVPQKYFVEQIAGDLLDVEVLVSPGANPHMYEPTPAQMSKMTKAKAYFAIGINLENTWLPRINGTVPSLRMVYTQRGVEKIPMAAHEHHHDDDEGQTKHLDHDKQAMHAEGEHHDHEGLDEHSHDHGTLDPHIWLDPIRVKTIARNICKGLGKADPANSATYEANLEKFLMELDKLNTDITAILADVPSNQRSFLVFHPSWGYFAQRYGLTQLPIESQGREPSPKELAEIIKEAKTKDIKVIFVQPQISQRTAKAIASQIGGSVEQLDPLSINWKDNLINAAKAFKQHLNSN
ncbi:metal ABC transporter solute-binding protein, Zn/Mn family [Maridesulfovibrio sp.]|uniref:metal ABC transporter solute-binding protein, Zn/Mn family n=1 Tax=Maridesulfovibrio sp. TaxID=2795000 RepID=UPI0039EFA18E